MQRIQMDPYLRSRKFAFYLPLRMTCPDQSFFTAFALADNSVSVYMMNFKKGSTITKEKLEIENKKSYKIYNTLPLNVDPVYLNTGGGM